MYKKLFFMILAAPVILAGNAFAEIASGSDGGISWSISDSGELVISGTGEIPGYAKQDDGTGSKAPWYSYVDNISKITVSDGITGLGDRAFRGMTNVTEVSIPNSVTKIGNTVFENATSLNNVVIPDSVTSMGDYVFKEASSLTNITLSNNITSIGKEAFKLTSLTSIDIPNSVTFIGGGAFSGVPIENFVIPDSVTKLGGGLGFKNNTLKSLVIGNGITEIEGVNAFMNLNSLKTLILGNSLTSIGKQAFINCWSVENLVLPDSLINIAERAFSNFHITNLTATAEQLQAYIDAGGDFRKNAKIICKSGDCETVLNNSAYAGKATIEYAAYEEHNPDGSISVYKDGKLVGFKNKRIYTVNEAEALSKPTGNKFRIRYK